MDQVEAQGVDWGRLDEIVPVGPATMEDRHFIEWDKDDIDALRMIIDEKKTVKHLKFDW